MTDKIRYYPTIWISDIHLGYKDCKAEFLLDFLSNTHCDTLYLVGDIVDLWSLKRQFFWHSSHYKVLETLQQKVSQGTNVIYIPGNHDETFRRYVGQSLMGIEVAHSYIHTTQQGKRLLLVHGDDFDSVTRYNWFVSWLGDQGYDLLLFLNRWSNRIRRFFGGRYWSLASWLKKRVHKAVSAIDAFERAAIREAKRQGVDGIVCGHIHQPNIRIQDGIIYCNDGDWIENCTALVEHQGGQLALVHWSDVRKVLHIERLQAKSYQAA
ncbi:Ser/Thr protein phosphatase family protein,UDP-2,3-diacylglucosamine hydrolase [Pseudoalteromonas luteoviolacea B = ATCC 29581]|nr:Ser/Thr protein phosphatase family protein,UDP-2,3-diacylglucosamine hydrolase [Pseudoalteromonas luteoviolacea B = ATCC 29581]